MKFLLHVASGEREQSKTWGLIQQLSFFQEIQKGQIGCPWPWNRFIPTHKWNPKTRWPPKILVSRDTVVHNSPEYGRILPITRVGTKKIPRPIFMPTLLIPRLRLSKKPLELKMLELKGFESYNMHTFFNVVGMALTLK